MRSQAWAPPWGTLCTPTSVSAGEPGRVCPAGSTGIAGPASILSPPQTFRGAPPAPQLGAASVPPPHSPSSPSPRPPTGTAPGPAAAPPPPAGPSRPAWGAAGGRQAGERGRGEGPGEEGWGRAARAYLGLLRQGAGQVLRGQLRRRGGLAIRFPGQQGAVGTGHRTGPQGFPSVTTVITVVTAAPQRKTEPQTSGRFQAGDPGESSA